MDPIRKAETTSHSDKGEKNRRTYQEEMSGERKKGAGNNCKFINQV
jgi:hypothetical protein